MSSPFGPWVHFFTETWKEIGTLSSLLTVIDALFALPSIMMRGVTPNVAASAAGVARNAAKRSAALDWVMCALLGGDRDDDRVAEAADRQDVVVGTPHGALEGERLRRLRAAPGAA